MARWDYQADGGVYRDIHDEGIERLIARGEIKGDDKVAYSGTDQWTPVRSVPSFAAMLDRRSTPTEQRVTIPPVNNGNGARFYTLWVVVTIAFSYYSWHQAESYNPEGNRMFNLLEASISNQAWLQVIASLASAIFSSLFLAVGIIASRLRNIAEINRAGYLAVLEELRRGR